MGSPAHTSIQTRVTHKIITFKPCNMLFELKNTDIFVVGCLSKLRVRGKVLGFHMTKFCISRVERTGLSIVKVKKIG